MLSFLKSIANVSTRPKEVTRRGKSATPTSMLLPRGCATRASDGRRTSGVLYCVEAGQAYDGLAVCTVYHIPGGYFSGRFHCSNRSLQTVGHTHKSTWAKERSQDSAMALPALLSKTPQMPLRPQRSDGWRLCVPSEPHVLPLLNATEHASNLLHIPTSPPNV